METLVIGRASSNSRADLVVPASEDTVGRRHAELTIGTDGSIYLVDLRSANGTFARVGNKWKKITQAEIEKRQPLRLGEFETTAERLLLMRRSSAAAHARSEKASVPSTRPAATSQGGGKKPTSPARKPRRNPSTGEIE